MAAVAVEARRRSLSSTCSSIPTIASSGVPAVTVHSPYAGVPAYTTPETAADDTQSQQPKRPLCLDYLHGECQKKRAYCSFYHPDISSWPQGVCFAFYATGFCKYGVQCREDHPDKYAGVAGIALTRSMTKDQRERGEKAFQRQIEPPKVELTATHKFRNCVQSWFSNSNSYDKQELTSLLNCERNFEDFSCELVRMVLDCTAQDFHESIPRLLPEIIEKRSYFNKFTEAVVVSACSCLGKELQQLTPGSTESKSVDKLLAFLWQLYANGCGDHIAHESSLKIMCNSKFAYILTINDCIDRMLDNNKLASDHDKLPAWLDLVEKVRVAVLNKMQQPPPTPSIVPPSNASLPTFPQQPPTTSTQSGEQFPPAGVTYNPNGTHHRPNKHQQQKKKGGYNNTQWTQQHDPRKFNNARNGPRQHGRKQFDQHNHFDSQMPTQGYYYGQEYPPWAPEAESPYTSSCPPPPQYYNQAPPAPPTAEYTNNYYNAHGNNGYPQQEYGYG